MPSFRTRKKVHHSAQKMFDLVADIERYPEFLPMCKNLTVQSRREKGDNTLLVANMQVGYKLISESFTTQVYLCPKDHVIDVQYIDGPFKYLNNRWAFLPAEKEEAGLEAADNRGTKLGILGKAGRSSHTKAGHTKSAAKAARKSALLKVESCIVDFSIDYAFKSPMLSAIMGTMFDIAFRKFTQAFEDRADKIYS